MKELKQKCDYCDAEIVDNLGEGFEIPKRLWRLGADEACLNCLYKAADILRISKAEKWCEHNKNIGGAHKPCPICELKP